MRHSFEYPGSGHVHGRRLLSLLAVSALLHALVLVWVKAPARTPDAPLSFLTASLRFAAETSVLNPEPAAAPLPVVEHRAPTPAPEARRPSVRREPKSLPAVPQSAEPTSVVPIAVPSASEAPVAPAAPVASSLPVAMEPTLAPVDEVQLLEDYGRSLSALFARSQQYPRIAAQRGWEGEVRVRLTVGRKGALGAVVLERSSGHEVLDRHALSLVEQIGRLPAPPAELVASEIQIVVPVLYKLRSAS